MILCLRFATCKLVWIPSVYYIPNYYLQNCVSLCILLAFVAVLLVTTFCRRLSVRETQNLVIAVGRVLDLAEFLLIRGLFLFFLSALSGGIPHTRRTECAKIKISQSGFSNLKFGKKVNIFRE